MPIVRAAVEAELEYLTDLALKSKASNGYDEEFMVQCVEELKVEVPEGGLDNIRVAEVSREIVGFCAVLGKAPEGELGFMFVEPARKGEGIGRCLFNSAVNTALSKGFKSLTIDSDPHAEISYKKLGAVEVRKVPSGSIEGRELTQFRVTLV